MLCLACGVTLASSGAAVAEVEASALRTTPGLTPTQRREILEAAPRATVRSAHWSQFVTGAAYTNTQDGTFYWDGSRVWVTQSYSGYRGTHRCFTNYVLAGWQVTNISKSDTGSTTSRSLYCGWNVVQPMWITTSWSMTATVNRNGGVTGVGCPRDSGRVPFTPAIPCATFKGPANGAPPRALSQVRHRPVSVVSPPEHRPPGSAKPAQDVDHRSAGRCRRPPIGL